MSCPSGKIGYATQQVAWSELQKINARRSKHHAHRSPGWFHGARPSVVHCPDCGQYHISRKTASKRGQLNGLLFCAALTAGSFSIAAPDRDMSEAEAATENVGRDCIALAVFTEARGESIEGQIAVAEVIRTRMESSRWPAFPCDVVEQLDQFHGFRDWPRPQHPRNIDANAWELALRVTDGVMLEGWSACGGDADHFFAGPAPRWAVDMRPVCTIGAHQFVAEVR